MKTLSATLLILLLPLIILCTLSIHATSLSFNYKTFRTDDVKDFIKEKSDIVINVIQLTPPDDIVTSASASISNRSGRILYREPLKLWNSLNSSVSSFNTTFVLNITPRTFPGGEGLAFILTGRNDCFPENSHGPWLGIVNSTLDGNIENQIVAVEFDTKKSSDHDIDSNHIAVDVNSVYSNYPQVSLDRYGVALSAAEDIAATVQYDGDNKRLSVFVESNGTQNLVMSVLIDLTDYLPETVFVGFSAATSDATELNCIKSWVFEGLDVGHDQSNIPAAAAADVENSPRKIPLWGWILIGVVGSAAVLLSGIVVYMRRGDCSDSDSLEIENQIQHVGPKKMKLAELKKATSNFSSNNKLGQGGFGTVYRGRLSNGIEVAVKRTSKKVQEGKQEFLAEVTTVSGLNHKNLVKLLGWCHEGSELLLVYEYMPNRSLDKLIYGPSVLDFERRCGILRGVAEVVEYLHHGCENRVFHRDIKASNVMLDSAFNARLGDFGLARTIQRIADRTHHSTHHIAGTAGYMAPESLESGKITVEIDVYSFGVLVLTVVCGRRPVGSTEDYSNLVWWVWDLHRRGCILNAVALEPTLVGDEAVMSRMLLLGLGCCHPDPNKRPCMRKVLQILDGEAPPPAIPDERPAFLCPSSNRDPDPSVTDSQLSPITEVTELLP